MSQRDDFEGLLFDYFSLGVAEGKEGRNHDTEVGAADNKFREIVAEWLILHVGMESAKVENRVLVAQRDEATKCLRSFVDFQAGVLSKAQECLTKIEEFNNGYGD
jgi:hypothetical protein